MVDSVPLLSIGLVEGDAPYLFGDVSGAIRIDSIIAVADAQVREIRIFDLNGLHIRTVGRFGRGPGEFLSIAKIRRCNGGQMYVFDNADRTVQIRSTFGELVEEFSVLDPSSSRPRRPRVIECAYDGDAFVSGGWSIATTQGLEEGVVYSRPASIWLLAENGTPLINLGPRLASERFVRIAPNGGVGVNDHPFGRSALVAIDQERVIIAEGEFDIDVYDHAGRLVRKFRGPPVDLEISERLLDTYRAATLEGDALEDRERLAAMNFPMPARFPGYTEMRLDPSGALWLRRFAAPWEDHNRWLILSPAGVALGHLALPSNLRIEDIGDDWMLGTRTDELGVERVNLYRLTKPSG